MQKIKIKRQKKIKKKSESNQFMGLSDVKEVVLFINIYLACE
jgi:hypothetical protein